MTSSSSLYGTVTTQNSSSSNSTSLYGEAGTPIPDSSGNVVVRGDLVVLSGNILTTAATGNIFPANATTINLGLAATAVNIGAASGTTTINNALTVGGDITAEGADFGNITIAVADDNTITTTANNLKLSAATNSIGLVGVDTLYTDTTGTFLLLNAPSTLYAFDSATTLELGALTGTTTVRNDLIVGGGITADGADLGNITIGVATDNTITTTSGNLNLTAIAAGAVNITSETNAPTLITRNTTATSSSIRSLSLAVQSSGTPAAGFGNTLEWQVEAQAGNTERAGFISVDSTDLTAGSEDFTMNFGLMQAGAAYATKMTLDSAGNLATDGDLTVGGNAIGLAQATTISYSENDDRANRPQVQSTTGNTSGWRVMAPNATTSAVANISAFSSDDGDNGKFISINARGATSADLRIQTGKYTAGVLGASGTVVSYIDNVTVYATVNPAGPTNALDLTTKAYVDAQVDSNTTYTVDSSSTTGGANFNLVGSDSTTDTIKFANGSNVTVTATSANEITIAATDTNTTYTQDASSTTGGANLNLVGSDSTTDTIKFAGGTNVTVVATDANTITINAPDTNTTYTIDASSTTGGANLNLVGSDSTTDTVKIASGTGVTVAQTSANELSVAIGQAVGIADDVQFNSVRTGTINANAGVSFVNTGIGGGTYATVNAFGPANTDDLTTVGYVNSILPTVVTYTIDASSTTGGANLNLVGSNSITDTVKIASGTGVTVAQTSANELSVAIGQSVATSADVTFNTVNANLTDDNYVLGQLYATRNTAWTAPPVPLTTLAGQNGIYAVSSGNGAGYAPAIQAIYYSGDTTAGVQASAAFAVRGASGTNSAPGAAASNQVMGTMNYDGYGTTNWASTIATTNAGAGTASLNPLQAQGYARQAFADSGAVATTVTGASGTGSVATLTFTLQNTAPYAVGQTVVIAGMTPSGYNGTVVLTAATTSSISYANATTGFTSGGTITATRTVTAAGMGFRIRGYASSTNMTSANRFNFMDLTASAATFKSAAYTFANDVITGSTLTATNYMTLGSTGITMGNVDGLTNFVRASGGTVGTRPVASLRNTQTVTAAPATGDGSTFRQQVAGSNGTAYNLTEIGGTYSTTGDTSIAFNIANGDQTAAIMTVVQPLVTKLSGTTIKATATPTATAGGNTLTDVAIFTPANTTIKSDAVTLQTNAGVALVSGKITYSRQYGNFLSSATQTNPVANAENLMVFGTTDIANGVSIVTNGTALTRITFSTACVYDMQFSAQIAKTAAGNDNCYIWLKKNGTTVAATAGITRVSGNGDRIMASWNYLVNAAAGDYYEIAWSATDTDVILQASSPGGVVPTVPSVILSVVPVGA